MRYRPTPLNLLSTILIGWTIWTYNPKSETMGWGEFALIVFIGFGVVGLIIDFGIQIISKNYLKTIGTEIILIAIVGLLYSYSQRTKTLIISDSPSTNYIVTVYGVKGQPKLTDKFLPWTWTYEVKIPESGILLTSSDFGADLPETKMVTYSGAELNTDKSEWGWIRFSDNEINCKGQTFKYRSWMINKEFCCGYSNKDVDSLQIRLQRQLCEDLMPSR